ncbi:MAG: hypothetical protein WBB36_17250 [Chitinophagales bacterium]
MKFSSLMLLLLAWTALHAQDTSQHFNRLGMQLGGQQTHLLDAQFSPLIYRANEITVDLYYEGKHNRSNWKGSFSFATGTLIPPAHGDRKLYNTTEDIYGNIITDSFFVEGNTLTAVLELGYEYDVVRKASYTISAGGGIREQLMYPSTFVNLGIINTASLLAAATIHFHPDAKNDWTAGLQLPVVSLNSRFPYSGTVSQPEMKLLGAFFDGTQFVSLGHYQQVNLQLGYHRQLSDKWRIGATYEFEWLKDNETLPLKLFSNLLVATVDYTF